MNPRLLPLHLAGDPEDVEDTLAMCGQSGSASPSVAMQVDILRGGMRASPIHSSQRAATAAFFVSLAAEARAAAGCPGGHL